MSDTAKVVITGWQSGLQKITMTHLLQEYTEMGLKDAKACTDRVLEGEAVFVTVGAEEHAQQLAEKLRAIGANAETA